MEQNKIICKKGKFIDEVFGDEIEYARIYENKGITIIFSCDNTLVVKHFKNTRELIESYISMYNENEFTNIMFSDLDNLMAEVQRENEELKLVVNNEKVLNDICKSMDN